MYKKKFGGLCFIMFFEALCNPVSKSALQIKVIIIIIITGLGCVEDCIYC